MLGWLLLALAMPQSADTDPCTVADACRKIETVRVQSPDGKETALPVNQTLPWVVQDNLLLVPGDWIVIRLIERDGALVPQLIRAGNSGQAPDPGDGEIRIRIMPFNKGNLMMEVLSKRSETLDYAALIVTVGRGAERTSVCSLHPNIPVFEAWQQPIRQIALWSFRPTTDPGCKTLDLKKKNK